MGREFYSLRFLLFLTFRHYGSPYLISGEEFHPWTKAYKMYYVEKIILYYLCAMKINEIFKQVTYNRNIRSIWARRLDAVNGIAEASQMDLNMHSFPLPVNL